MSQTAEDAVPVLPAGWSYDGPRFKDEDSYLSKDGTNPEAPWPGYGWPQGSECWYFVVRGTAPEGYEVWLVITGLTAASAARRAEEAARSPDPLRFVGAIR